MASAKSPKRENSLLIVTEQTCLFRKIFSACRRKPFSSVVTEESAVILSWRFSFARRLRFSSITALPSAPGTLPWERSLRCIARAPVWCTSGAPRRGSFDCHPYVFVSGLAWWESAKQLYKPINISLFSSRHNTWRAHT